MHSSLTALSFWVLTGLIQALAAIPWLVTLNRNVFRTKSGVGGSVDMLWRLGLLVLVGVLPGLWFAFTDQDPTRVAFWGGVYGAVLYFQLILDVFVLGFALLLWIWPKAGAVALAAFREGVRQPMFWFIMGVSLFLMCALTPLLPYFTFGEDYKMVKELGYGIIMLAAGAFGILNASMSISEEIEGRTAVTLMSKPVSRRQFLLGKFLGIAGVCLFMTAVLSWFYDGSLLMKLQYLNWDQEPMPTFAWLEPFRTVWAIKLGDLPGAFAFGNAWWFGHVLSMLPGVVLGFGQAMVLVAIAVALATRLPMIVNIVCCTVIFFLGNLTPVLAQISQGRYPLIKFMAQVFGSVLPGLDFFNMGTAITRDTPLPTGPFAVYLGTVSLYAVLYTAVALLLGLILFEDRDLA